MALWFETLASREAPGVTSPAREVHLIAGAFLESRGAALGARGRQPGAIGALTSTVTRDPRARLGPRRTRRRASRTRRCRLRSRRRHARPEGAHGCQQPRGPPQPHGRMPGCRHAKALSRCLRCRVPQVLQERTEDALPLGYQCNVRSTRTLSIGGTCRKVSTAIAESPRGIPRPAPSPARISTHPMLSVEESQVIGAR